MKSVLVVDDQPDVADSMAMVLEALGHDVRVAYDAVQALTFVYEQPPDVAVLALGMPVVSGYELAQRMRAMNGALLTLVAHSAWDDEDTRRHISRVGFDAHLTKPASIAQLISAVEGGRALGFPAIVAPGSLA